MNKYQKNKLSQMMKYFQKEGREVKVFYEGETLPLVRGVPFLLHKEGILAIEDDLNRTKGIFPIDEIKEVYPFGFIYVNKKS